MTHNQTELAIARSALLERWAAPSEKIERHLSKPGYELPDISDFAWHALKGINNWALVPREIANWADRRTFEFGAHSRDNIVVFGKGATTGRLLFHGSRNLAIILGLETWLSPVNVNFFTDDHVFFWGAGCTSNTVTFELGSGKTNIVVGEDCMFSAGIAVRTHDDHGIVDLNSHEMLNPAASVHFEPHVWVGLDASILKGVRIGFGSIIGTKALVTRDVPRRCIVGGIPARVIREGVGWVRSRHVSQDAVNHLAKLAAQWQIE